MNEKVNALLAKIDAEVIEKVNARVIERDAEIKAKAQKAYDNAVAEAVEDIKAEVEKDYEMARKYLADLREPEVAEAPIAAEPVESKIADSASPVI